MNRERKKIVFAFEDKSMSTISPRVGAEGVGIDLPIQEDITLEPGKKTRLNTNVKIVAPEGHYIQIFPRSSCSRLNIDIFTGVIDPQFNGSIKVVAENKSSHDINLKKGDFIAQAVIIACKLPHLQEANSIEIDSERGKGSFGSTNLYLEEGEVNTNSIYNYIANTADIACEKGSPNCNIEGYSCDCDSELGSDEKVVQEILRKIALFNNKLIMDDENAFIDTH